MSGEQTPSEEPDLGDSDIGQVLDDGDEPDERERVQFTIVMDSIGDGSSPEEVRASWLAEVKRRR